MSSVDPTSSIGNVADIGGPVSVVPAIAAASGLAIYPSDVRGLTFTVTRRPVFDTLVQASASNHETRIAQSQNPTWHWLLIYDYLYNATSSGMNNVPLAGRDYPDLQILLGFFLARQGRFDAFLFDDPDDNHVGPAVIDGLPNLKAELQLVQDSDTGIWYSPVQRNMGGQFFEDVTDLNGAITVCANGVPQIQGFNFNIGGPGLAIPGYSFAGLYLVWASTPAGPITAEFDFYWRVRFASDRQDFEKFMEDLWTIGGHGKHGSGYIELQSVRAAGCMDSTSPPSGEGEACPAQDGDERTYFLFVQEGS